MIPEGYERMIQVDALPARIRHASVCDRESHVPLYYFDIFDGGAHTDEIGTECENDEAVRRIAMQTLPRIASDEIPSDGDRRHFTVVARDEAGLPVYTATLSFAGVWLRKWS